MKRTAVISVLAALLIAGALWFYTSFERVSEREHVGFRGEAARNPMLALTRLMERMGVKVRSSGKTTDLDQLEAAATMLLPAGRAEFTQPRAERMAAWVAAGGYLIVQAEPLGKRDTVLDALKVGRTGAPAANRAELARVRFPQVQDLRVVMRPAITFTDDAPDRKRYVASDSDGTIVLHLVSGHGRVTVLPSFEFLGNGSIGEHDHAALAWELVRFVPGTAIIVIAPNFEHPSLVAWLAREARIALIAAAAVLLFWAWRAATRFGPVEPDRALERRRLLDHLRASGRYLWRAGAGSKLLAAARETCLQKIARTRPGLAELPPAERAGPLAKLTELPAREIELAWTAEPETPAAFTAAVRTLQQIDEKLTRKPTM